MDEVKDVNTTVVFTDSEYATLMDALWSANARFEYRDMMDEANKCMDLWKTLYNIRYGKTGEAK
jgi:hypothetical protein